MSEYTLPFMQQPSMGADGYFNMGQWGGSTNPAATGFNSVGSGIPYSDAFGGFGAGMNTGFAQQPGSWWDRMKGDLGDGMTGFNQGVSAFSNLAGIYAGFKSLGLAKDQFKFAKSSFNKNFNASAQAYNNQLRDKHEQRKNIYESRGRSYEGMDTWMSEREIQKVGKNRKG